MTFITIPFQQAVRDASVQLLTDYAFSVNTRLQVYPGRPRTIKPPTAFIDSVSERVVLTGPLMRQRTATVNLIVIHNIFDSADATSQKATFVDGFLDWLLDNYHAAGATTGFGDAVAVEDIPNYVPDWLPPEEQRSYYATQIAVEGFAGG